MCFKKMNVNIQNLILRLERHKDVTDAKFSLMLEQQKTIDSALKELQEESADFYGYVAESLKELDKEITLIKEKIKGL